MILEAAIGGGIIWYALRSSAAGKLRNVVANFKRDFSDAMEEDRVQEPPNVPEAKAAYNFVIRDMVAKAALDDLRPIAELFSKYRPPE